SVSATWTDNCGVKGAKSGNVAGVAGTVQTGADGCSQYRDYTFDITDDCANVAVQKKVRITRQYDVTIPVITAPADYTLTGCNTDWPASVSATWTDNCGVKGAKSGNVAGVAGTVQTGADGCSQYRDYTFDITDDCTNVAVQKKVRITRQYDVTIPVITAPADYTLTGCNTDWPASVSATWTDNCGVKGAKSGNVAGVAGTVQTGADGCSQYRDYTFDITDDCTNVAVQKKVRITRQYDVTIPVITAPADYTLTGCNTDWPASVSATWTDNCGVKGAKSGNVAGVAGTVQTGADGCSQYRDYTFDITDDCTNVAVQKKVRITRQYDVTIPVITAPADYTLTGCNTDWPASISATWTDNCGIKGAKSGNVAGVAGTVQTGADGCSQYRDYTFDITDDCTNVAVQKKVRITRQYDVTIPVITAPADYTLTGCNTDWPASVSATWTDNCGVKGAKSGNVAGVAGTVQTGADGCSQYRDYTFDITDDCTNVAVQKKVRITKQYDVTPPELTCAADKTQDCGTTPSFVDPTVKDNCDANPVLTHTDSSNGDVFTRTWTATDACSNKSATCSQVITIGSCGHLFPTATTCCSFRNGSAQAFTQVCYTASKVKGKLIVSNATPGVFFYYAKIKAPSSSFCVDVLQTRACAELGFFALQKDQIILWDKNCNKASNTTVTVTGGNANICITGATKDDEYVISVKYDTKSIVGTPSNGNCEYTFVSQISGLNVSGSQGKITASKDCQVGTISAGSCSSTAAIAPIETTVTAKTTSNAGFDAYPVPFKDQLTIKYKFDYKSDVKIEVFNAQGISVLTKTDTNSYFDKEITLDLKASKRQEQMYVVKVTTNRGSTTKKIMSSK
ncbi:T9SS type A sorting domain-containing protein, partial [Flavobacterium sp. LB1P62]|uniref:T9SS type A sorting domain-containing protein n=1 Tax=Flavobacterium sp. LB1P62 TaxID=3401715 RepID=UPI003AAFB117